MCLHHVFGAFIVDSGIIYTFRELNPGPFQPAENKLFIVAISVVALSIRPLLKPALDYIEISYSLLRASNGSSAIIYQPKIN